MANTIIGLILGVKKIARSEKERGWVGCGLRLSEQTGNPWPSQYNYTEYNNHGSNDYYNICHWA